MILIAVKYLDLRIYLYRLSLLLDLLGRGSVKLLLFLARRTCHIFFHFRPTSRLSTPFLTTLEIERVFD